MVEILRNESRRIRTEQAAMVPRATFERPDLLTISIGETKREFDLSKFTKRTEPPPNTPQRTPLEARSREGHIELKISDKWTRITADQEVNQKVRFGEIPWVYEEELSQRRGLGINPTGNRIWFTRFDNRPVQDYFLLTDQRRVQNQVQALPYPKAGTTNPIAELWTASAPDWKPSPIFNVPSTEFEYVWGAEWVTPEILWFRAANRLQNTQTIFAWSAAHGLKKVHTESQPNGFVSSFWNPEVKLQNGQWRPGERLLATQNEGFYRYISVKLDGSGTTEIMPKSSFDVDPSGVAYADSKELIFEGFVPNRPGDTAVYHLDLKSKKLSELSPRTPRRSANVTTNSDASVIVLERSNPFEGVTLKAFSRKGAKLSEISQANANAMKPFKTSFAKEFDFLAADGKTPLTARMWTPRDFDPAQKYPVLFSIYSGPEMGDLRPGFQPEDPWCALGMIVVKCEVRGGLYRGSAFRNMIYRNLGRVEVDDLAACANALQKLPYIKPNKIFLSGTSYGGYASLMGVLRYPDQFAGAIAGSPVTDWTHYDTIYTERYMGLPNENAGDYEVGSLLPIAKNLKRPILIHYGTSDDNVHPANTLQFTKRLDDAGIEFELSTGLDQGHVGPPTLKVMRFLSRYALRE